MLLKEPSFHNIEYTDQSDWNSSMAPLVQNKVQMTWHDLQGTMLLGVHTRIPAHPPGLPELYWTQAALKHQCSPSSLAMQVCSSLSNLLTKLFTLWDPFYSTSTVNPLLFLTFCRTESLTSGLPQFFHHRLLYTPHCIHLFLWISMYILNGFICRE